MREERVTIFGNIENTPPDLIRRFTETTGNVYGGAYPCRQPGLSDEEVVGRTRAVLAQAGILDTSPITLCNSEEERMRKILDACAMRRRQNGVGLYWIIDNNPDSLVVAVRAIRNQDNHEQAEILAALTITKLNSTQISDYRDAIAGIRVVALPFLYHFPTHPTPAS